MSLLRLAVPVGPGLTVQLLIGNMTATLGARHVCRPQIETIEPLAPMANRWQVLPYDLTAPFDFAHTQIPVLGSENSGNQSWPAFQHEK